MSQSISRLSILAAAQEHGARTAMVVEGREYSYGEVALRVGMLLEGLRRRGLHPTTEASSVPRQRIAMSGDSSRAALLLAYSLMELGLPLVPLHPRLSAEEKRRLLRECEPEQVLEPDVDVVELQRHGSHSTLPVGTIAPPDDERCLALIYTSGTGGQPRGVVLSRRAFVAAAQASAQNLGWQEGDRWLLSLPLAHIGGLSVLTRCLEARACVVVEPLLRFDPVGVAEAVSKHRITLLSLVPTMLKRLLDLEGWQPPGHLRAMLLGGAPCSPGLLGRAADRGWPVLTTYGLTEACSQVATLRPGSSSRGELGCGPPLPGLELRLVDDCVQVRGPALMSAYFPVDSHPNPFTADGWLQTEDLGRVDEQGNLHVLGRRDAVIISGGENVHPAEVEAILEEHPGIAAACVFGTPDEEWGQRVVAALVAVGDPPPAEDLVAHCTERLAPFKRPRQVAFLPGLPRTSSGKVQRSGAVRLARPALRPLS